MTRLLRRVREVEDSVGVGQYEPKDNDTLDMPDFLSTESGESTDNSARIKNDYDDYKDAISALNTAIGEYTSDMTEDEKTSVKKHAGYVLSEIQASFLSIEVRHLERKLTTKDGDRCNAARSVLIRMASELSGNLYSTNGELVMDMSSNPVKMNPTQRKTNIQELGKEGIELTEKRWVDMNKVGWAVLGFVAVVLVAAVILASVAVTGGAAAVPIAAIAAYCGFGLAGVMVGTIALPAGAAITIGPATATILAGTTVLTAVAVVPPAALGTARFFTPKDKGAADAVGKFVTQVDKPITPSGEATDEGSDEGYTKA